MERYLHFDSNDFAQEQSFIRWVKKTNDSDVVFWEDWISSHPEKKEEIDKAIFLVNQLQFKDGHLPKGSKEKVWSKIEAQVSNDSQSIGSIESSSKKSGRRGILRLISLGAVAASIAIFIIVNKPKERFDTKVQTLYAESQKVTLPDGSIVSLNADSQLSYDKETWDKTRAVHLEGEAFFEVKKGSLFVVRAETGNVTVLGTSFNVYTRNQKLEVFCKTGKVLVYGGKVETILNPEQGVSIIGSKHEMKKPKDVDRLSWQEGIFNYQAESLSEVIKELERQLDVKIALPENLKEKQFTGSFNKQDVEGALSEVLWPLNLKFSIEGKEVSISE